MNDNTRLVLLLKRLLLGLFYISELKYEKKIYYRINKIKIIFYIILKKISFASYESK